MRSRFAGVAAALCAVCCTTVFSQTLRIDYRYNIAGTDTVSVRGDAVPENPADAGFDPDDHFNWSFDALNVKDGFDAETGASAAHSTSAFAAAFFDASGKAACLPYGLKALLLYPVTGRSFTRGDFFAVTSGEASLLTVTFIHRGIAYRITTDKDGLIHIDSGFEIARGIAVNDNGAFVPDPKYIKDMPGMVKFPEEGSDGESSPATAGSESDISASNGADTLRAPPADMKDIDWAKLEFVNDLPSPDADSFYTGMLKAVYRNGILTLTGRLKRELKKVPEKTDGTTKS